MKLKDHTGKKVCRHAVRIELDCTPNRIEWILGIFTNEIAEITLTIDYLNARLICLKKECINAHRKLNGSARTRKASQEAMKLMFRR